MLPPSPYSSSFCPDPLSLKLKESILRPPVSLQCRHHCYRAKEVGSHLLQLQEYPRQMLPPSPFSYSFCPYPLSLKLKGSILRPPVSLECRHHCYRTKEVGYPPSTLQADEVGYPPSTLQADEVPLRPVDFDHKLEPHLSSLGVSAQVLGGLLEIDLGTDGTGIERRPHGTYRSRYSRCYLLPQSPPSLHQSSVYGYRRKDWRSAASQLGSFQGRSQPQCVVPCPLPASLRWMIFPTLQVQLSDAQYLPVVL